MGRIDCHLRATVALKNLIHLNSRESDVTSSVLQGKQLKLSNLTEVQTIRGRGQDLKARQPGPREDAILVLPAGEAGPLWDEALTFHHDLQGGLAVLDAMYHLAAIDPRVIGAQVLDFQGGIAGDGRVVG